MLRILRWSVRASTCTKLLWLPGNCWCKVIKLLSLFIVLLLQFSPLSGLFTFFIVKPFHQAINLFGLIRFILWFFNFFLLVEAPSSWVRGELIWWLFHFFHILLFLDHVEPLRFIYFLSRSKIFCIFRVKIMLFWRITFDRWIFIAENIIR
mgnify:CR=1 FL=1